MKIKNNFEEASRIGILRQNAHITNSSPRFFSDKNEEDIIGVSGELAFSKAFNLEMDKTQRTFGDNNIDFSVSFGNRIITIDVKTARKPFNLLVKEKEIVKCSDILVLAKYSEEEIEFLGWETKGIMSIMNCRDFGYGICNYYREVSQLRPMNQLKVLLDERDKT